MPFSLISLYLPDIQMISGTIFLCLLTFKIVLKCHHHIVAGSISILMSRYGFPCCPPGHQLRPSRRTTAATLALFWTSRLLRWQTWIQRCLLFHLATVSGTCCWETRHFRMMTGSVEKHCYSTVCKERGCHGIYLEVALCFCVCMCALDT